MSDAKIYLVWDEAFQQDILGVFSSEELAVQFASNYDEDGKLWLEVWQIDGKPIADEIMVLP